MNTLQFLLNLQKVRSEFKIDNQSSDNRMNSVGESFELYVKNIFANYLDSAHEDNLKYDHCFSYTGNKTNSPDLMLKNGDAIEIKKIEAIGSDLALNSSTPKNKIYANSKMITDECRDCENWTEKDILYIVGTIPKKTNNLTKLWLVYGDCYCANSCYYETVRDRIKSSISASEDIESSETNELGRINKIDPLRITNLRVRGMWTITHPTKVFKYLETTKDFDVNCILLNSKYFSFPEIDRQKIESNSNIKISDVKIKDPNNPAQLLDAKLIQANLCL